MKKKVMAMFMIFILTWAFSASVNASEIFKASNDPVIESVERFFDLKAQNFHTESQKNTRSIRLPEISISETVQKDLEKRSEFIESSRQRMGIIYLDVETSVEILSSDRSLENFISFEVMEINTITYRYPENVNSDIMTIGTFHTIGLVKENEE